jgi:NAD+ synthase (glutamine-hydrolysing)
MGRFVKIGMANLDSVVGAPRANTDQIIASAIRMVEEGVTIGAFPELAIPSYSGEDLVAWVYYLQKQTDQLIRFAHETADLGGTVFVLGVMVSLQGHIYNCAAVVQKGKILGIVPKQKLPSYGVFDEWRVFTPGLPGEVTTVTLRGWEDAVPFGDLIFDFPFGTVAPEVCEDIWMPDGPAKAHAYEGAEIVVNISASPWRAGVIGTKREMLPTRSADNACVLVYVNRSGGQEALVFDGACFVYKNGQKVLETERWKRNQLSFATIDLDSIARSRHQNTTWRTDANAFHAVPREKNSSIQSRVHSPQPSKLDVLPSLDNVFIPWDEYVNARAEYFEDLIQAMTTGLESYLRKTGRSLKVALALSGGKDSALCAIIAWLWAKEMVEELEETDPEGFVREAVYCFSLPTKYNSDQTKSVAERLCEDLGLSFREVPIQEAVDEVTRTVSEMTGEEVTDEITLQNIQARVRGNLILSWANTAHAFVIQTSNMSEKAVGYATYGGDMLGAYSLLGNLPKTVVIELLRYLRDKYQFPSLELLLATPSSAELKPNQTDEAELMPFPVLDFCFEVFAGEKVSPVELYERVRQKFTDEMLLELRPDYRQGDLKLWVKRFIVLFFRSIWKWIQTPLAVHLGPLDLDHERALQLPASMELEWLDLDEIDKLPD